MDLTQFLDERYLILIPALWVIGYALKNTPRVPNWSVLYVLILASVIFSFLMFGWKGESVVHAIIAAGAAVLGHQLVKQTINAIPPDKPLATQNGKKLKK